MKGASVMLTTYPPAQVIIAGILSFFFASWIKKRKTKGRIIYYLFTVSALPVCMMMLSILWSDGKTERLFFSALAYLVIWGAVFLLLLFGQIRMREEWEDDEAWTKFEIGFACSLLIFVFLVIAVPGSMYLYRLVW